MATKTLTLTTGADQRPLALRLWTYQAERFPLARHGVLIGAFASSAICVSALLAGRHDAPRPTAFLVAFAVLLGLFLLLRIADEFKDAATDALYRPERAVPRGLVSLRQLEVVGAVTVILQAAIVVLYDASLLVPLALTWGYFLLMTREFFVAGWLQQRPFAYMASHMLIMPLVDLFATACEWWPAMNPPTGLQWFLALSFFNGAVIEIGRKTWSPDMERIGVDSYSSAWGLRRALAVWLAAAGCALALMLVVAVRIDFVWTTGAVMGLLALCMVHTAMHAMRRPTAAFAKRIENLAGAWVFASYLMLGAVPMALR